MRCKLIHMNDSSNINDIKPPYLSTAKMQKLLDLLGSRNFSQISTNDLINRDFSKVEAFQALHTLRFLGLLDQEGRLINSQFLTLKGEARQNGLFEAIKRGYAKLFNRVTDPSMLPKEQLYNEFVAEYGLSARLTNSALPLFLWLCKEAGMRVSVDIVTRNRESNFIKNKTLKNKINYEEEKNLNINQYHSYNISGIILQVPKNPETDLLILKGELAEITQKIVEFVEKIPKKSENLNGGIL